MQDVGDVAFTCSSTAAITLSSHAPVSYLLAVTIIDAELNRQFPLAIDLNKILPDLLKLRTKAEKPDIPFSQHKLSKGTVWQ